MPLLAFPYAHILWTEVIFLYKVINGKKNSQIERLFIEKEMLFVALLIFTLLRFGQFAVL